MKFISDKQALVFQDEVTEKALASGETGVWAEFKDHEFVTDDKKVIARLKKVDGVRVADEDDTEPEPVPEPEPVTEPSDN